MAIWELCIRRPVFATVLNLLIILVGIVSYQRLTVREYPNIDVPVVTVTTVYRGASSDIIESQITKVIEDSLSGIEGIDYMTSVSRAERSQITVNFKLNRPSDAAASDVRDRVGRVRGRLPDEIDEPIIAKVEADAQPIMFLAFSSDRHSQLELTDYADRYVQDQLQTLPGVSEVAIYGERRYAMRIWLDPVKLAAYQLTVQDVEDALRRQNLEVPAGRIESTFREFTVSTKTDLRTPEQFNNIILRNSGGYLVKLKDVGRAALGAYDERRRTRYNGQAAVGLGVIKQSTANPLEVSSAVQKEYPSILEQLPEGMRVNIAYNSALFIERSIEAVYHTIGEAVLLVVLVIFAFLRSVRATIIPLVTVPISLVGSFAIMSMFGFTVNTLTLLALVLAIGLVVDDAIVMMENIFRHIEEGLSPVAAALKGSKEIAFAVIAMTMTLAAVYAPVAFSTGRTGKLFTEFALTLAGTVIISGFIALTLTPMMCSRLLKHETKHGAVFRWTERLFDRMNDGYRRALSGSLRVKPVIVIAGVCVAVAAVFLFKGLKSELSPLEDRGNIVGRAVAPEGSTLDYLDQYTRQMEAFYAQYPEIEHTMMNTGVPVVNESLSYARLKDWRDRSRSQQEIAKDLQQKFASLPGVQAFANNPPSLGQRASARPVQFVVQTSGTYEDLQQLVDRIMAEMRNYPGFTNPDNDLKLNKPEIQVQVDREKAATLGVPIETIGRTLETFMGGRDVTRFQMEGQQYDVVVQVGQDLRRNPSDLSSVYVRVPPAATGGGTGGASQAGSNGQMVQLSNLVSVKETVAARELNHFNKLRAATIQASLNPGYALGEALEFLEDAAQRVGGPEARVDYNGESREFKQSSATLYVTFLLALLFIFLVLAAQFESWIDPLIIMLTVPLAMAGALLALRLTGGTLNVYSQIGLITLVGLITKHGILIVEFANQIREEGKGKLEAVIDAAVLRLRPILMTTGAMVLGALPLALATGAGAESRQQIGWVIVGGMSFGTLLTLFVVPTAYMLLARAHRAAEADQAVPGSHAGADPLPAE